MTYGDEPLYYAIPQKDIDRIMAVINSAKPPKFIDLRRFGYGRESVSMIRWAKSYDQNKGEIERWILQLDHDRREDVRRFITQRRSKNLKVTLNILKNFVAS